MNQIKAVIELLGVRQKEIADMLGITAQSLNIIYKSKKPRKYNNKIAEYLGIDAKYLTKEELTEEDKHEIAKRYFKIASTDLRYEISINKDDYILTDIEFLEIIKENLHEDYYKIQIKVLVLDMKIPEIVLNWGEIDVINSNKIIFKSRKTYEEFHLNSILIERAIVRMNKRNHKIYILELNNCVTLYVDVICKFLMEDDNNE